MIEHVELSTTGTHTRIDATIAGQTVWFKLPTRHFNGNVGDALLCLAFFPAMTHPPGLTGHAQQAAVQINLPADFSASEQLVNMLPRQQQIFMSWCPQLQPFSVQASTHTVRPDRPAETTVGASFSGGVDSHYSVLRHLRELSCLIHIDGFEFEPGSAASQQTIAHLSEQALRYNKELVVVETNALSFFRAFKLQRLLIYGAFLAVVGHLLGLHKFLIPSSYGFDELVPSGSHALTDGYWSSAEVTVEHDAGNDDRMGKIQYLSEHSEALEHILVCWDDHRENCGRCNKCLRTMIALDLLDLHPASFAGPLNLADVRRMPVKGTALAPVLSEYMDLAREKQRTSLLRALALAHLRHNVRQAARTVLFNCDDALTGGRLFAARHQRNRNQHSQWFELNHQTINR